LVRARRHDKKNLPPLIASSPVVNITLEDATEQIREAVTDDGVAITKETPLPLIVKHNESNMPLTHDEWIALIGEVPLYRERLRTQHRIDLSLFVDYRGIR
jgi:hypothetical protein